MKNLNYISAYIFVHILFQYNGMGNVVYKKNDGHKIERVKDVGRYMLFALGRNYHIVFNLAGKYFFFNSVVKIYRWCCNIINRDIRHFNNAINGACMLQYICNCCCF